MITSTMSIDTIEMTVVVPSYEVYVALWSQLYGFVEAKELWPEGWRVSCNPKSKPLRFVVFPAKKRAIASFQMVVTKDKQRRFRLQLFPNNFKPGEFANLQAIVAPQLPGFEYSKLFYLSRVSRLDLAVDSYSLGMEQGIPYRPGTRYSKRYVDGASLGTLYLGSEKSPLMFRVYDKRKQLGETKNQTSMWGTLTRHEAVLRGLGVPPAELLATVQNPFKSFFIVPTAPAKALASDDKGWQYFLTLCEHVGSAMALAETAPAMRKKYRTRLQKLAVQLPVPSNWHEELAVAMKRILPANVGESLGDK